MTPSTTIWDVLGPVIVLGIGWLVYLSIRGPKPRADMRRWFSTLPPPSSIPWEIPVDAEAPPPQPRHYTIVAQDPNDHPYDELTLNDIYSHLMEQHFEVGNMLADRDAAPARWRREHAADHGLVVR